MAPSRADDPRGTGWRARQLAFDLVPEPGFDREDFFVSKSNEQAYAMIEVWPDWPDAVLLIIGPAGAGKSHLGAIWAARSEARSISAVSLAQADVEALAAGPLLVENVEAAGQAQTQLFHLVNLMRERGAALLLTAREPPETWGLTIADLLSRLRLAPRAEIGPPDEALMRAVLVKLLIDRQLVVDTSIIEYAASRLDRSLESARAFIDELDRRALSLKAKITRTIAVDVVRLLTGGTEADSSNQDFHGPT